MTREEAIAFFKDMNECTYGNLEAVEMAIKALEQEPIIDVNVPHKIAEFFSNWDGNENAKMEISVNDMREIADVYRRKARIERQLKEIRQEPCEDAISRAEAVRVASGYCHPSNIAKELAKLPSVQPKYNASEWCHNCKEYDQEKHCCPRFNRVIRNAVEEIKRPKTGHWIKDIHNKILCSNCGKLHDVFDTDRWFEEHKYCYSCGARMIEPQTESEG